jgi:hypothetical protein
MENQIKLSEVEINKLFRFTEKKLVHWYDLQIEIVDHLASCIEDEMAADSKLTFDLALEKVYTGFGIFGFAKIVQERQIQLAKMAKSKWWNEFRNLFMWPNAVLLVLIISLITTVAYSVDYSILHELFLGIFVFMTTAYYIYILKDSRLLNRLLVLQFGSSNFLIQYVFDFILAGVVLNFNQLSPIAFTIYLSLGVLIKLISFKLYYKIRSEAKLLYPAVFLKQN